MRAVQRIELGRAELREPESPHAGVGEVVVDIMFAGVNPFDVQVLSGDIVGDRPGPLTLGAEATGTVNGRLVQISGGGLGAARNGTFAEQAVVPAWAILPLPEGASSEAAATVGVAGKTAWRAIHQLAHVERGDVVLVLGASGGVGQFAAQLAAVAGARVVCVVGTEQKARARGLAGLEVLVAGSAIDLARVLNGYAPNVVLDPLGGDYLNAVLSRIEPGGRIVSYGTLAGTTGILNFKTLYSRGLHLMGTSGGTTSEEDAAEALVGALQATALGDVVVATEVLPLEDGPAALARLRNRQVTGKLLLKP